MTEETDALELAAGLTIAWLQNSNTRVHADDVPLFLVRMHEAVEKLSASASAKAEGQLAAERYTPAVSVRKSLASPDHIISMIDGKPYRMLRRHLSSNGLTPDEYRARYGLKADYPMVAQTHSETRRTIAKAIGLGRQAKAIVEGALTEPAKEVAKRARQGVSEAKKAAQEHLGTSDQA